MASVDGGAALPARPLLLTFDDGYMDHYVHAFPILREFGAAGAFYPTSAAVLGASGARRRTRFSSSSRRSRTPTFSSHDIENAIAAGGNGRVGHDAARLSGSILGRQPIRRAPVLYCKQLLPARPSGAVRRATVDDLFDRFVTHDESGFAAELYVGVNELQEMHAAGMHVGGHGGRHAWLDRLSVDEQRQELEDSLGCCARCGTGRGPLPHLLLSLWRLQPRDAGAASAATLPGRPDG